MSWFCVGLLVLGFDVAFDKAQYSANVTWIGVGLSVGEKLIVASIPR